MNSTRTVSIALAGLLSVPISVFGWEAALNRVAKVTGETSAVVESEAHPGYAANADKALEADSAPAVLREAKSYVDGKVEPKRDKDDCRVYRKVKDCWTWTNWADSGESHEAPEDFLIRANSPSALQLYHEGPDAAGSWFGANQYWPDGKLKYDQGYGPSGSQGVLSTVLNFRFTARGKDGSTELYRFGATATRVDPTNETLVSWSDSTTNQFIRMVTTDIVEAMVQEKGEELVDFGTNYVKSLSCTKELVLTPEQIAQGVTFESHGANQNSAVEIGHGAKAAMDQEYVSSVHTATALRSVSVAIGAYASATNSDRTASTQAIAIGFTARADGSQAIAIGSGAKHLDDETDLTGDNTYAHGPQSLAIGYSAKAIGASTVAIGSSTAASRGKCTTATAKSATAIGFDARATGEGAMAVGYDVEASGKKSFALGAAASAQGASSVQIGPGTNKLDHTLQFEDVLIVKDGRVIGSQPDPKVVDPTQGQQSEELEITVTPGSYTTLLPTSSAPLAPGTETAVSCTGFRNYTVFVPNEDSVRPALPMSFQFELPSGVKHAYVGDTSFTRLPVRITLEQPYEGFVSARGEYFEDGTDWKPIVTNCTVYFDLDTGSFKSEKNSIEGFSLHAAKVFKVSYTGGAGETKAVTLMEAAPDKAFLLGTFYHYAVSVDQKVSQSDAPPFSSPLHATFTYETVNGSVTFTKDIEVK